MPRNFVPNTPVVASQIKSVTLAAVDEDGTIPMPWLATSSAQEKLTFAWMDNASIHHSIEPEITDRWLVDHRFVLLYLPPYSPELNVIEILWKHAKYHWRDFTSWTRDTLIQNVQVLLNNFSTKFHVCYA